MTYKQTAFQSAAEGIIDHLEKRGMEGYFFESSAACTEAILSSIPEGSVIAWGGSETIKECGLMDKIRQGGYKLIDRQSAKTPEEMRRIQSETILADYFLMSTNAVTLDGELVNIDGMGNRVAALINGPENVIVIAGMNKVVANFRDALSRIRNIASPANAKRLDRQTPCNFTGRCGDCLSPDCMCNQIVITRRSGIKGRIKVYLVAEYLGY